MPKRFVALMMILGTAAMVFGHDLWISQIHRRQNVAIEYGRPNQGQAAESLMATPRRIGEQVPDPDNPDHGS
jgi:hypothetical protein